MKDDIQPVVRQCKAKSKRTMERCRRPATIGKKVCYHHGGKSPGALKGNQTRLKYGRRSKAATEERKAVNALLRQMKEFEDMI